MSGWLRRVANEDSAAGWIGWTLVCRNRGIDRAELGSGLCGPQLRTSALVGVAMIHLCPKCAAITPGGWDHDRLVGCLAHQLSLDWTLCDNCKQAGWVGFRGLRPAGTGLAVTLPTNCREKRNCRWRGCGRVFIARQRNREYCSPKCKLAASSERTRHYRETRLSQAELSKMP